MIKKEIGGYMENIIVIDKGTFRHALTNLTKVEIIQIMSIFGYTVDIRMKKEEFIEGLLKKLDAGEVSEQLYLAIKGKAFSVDKNFYDGFFYKFDISKCGYNLEIFLNAIKLIADSTKDRKIFVSGDYMHSDTLEFNLEIIKDKPVYDKVEERSRYFKESIDAKVILYWKIGIIYIHSKNITESKNIKTFIQKVFNSKDLCVDNTKRIKLCEPVFDADKVSSWLEKNEGKVEKGNYSEATIQMLDMLEEFNNKNQFENVCLKAIYFKNEIADLDEENAYITELKYGGENLQNHSRIKKELQEGKKITGFKFEVQHKYIDVDTDEEKISRLPVIILYEKKYALRISISMDGVSVEAKILHQAYDDIIAIFMKKYTSAEVLNTDGVIGYLTTEICTCLDEEEEIEEKEAEWKFNG